jgi:3-dehydroquinate synthetase
LSALRKDKKNSSTELCLILPDETGSLSEKYINLDEDVLQACLDSLVKALSELELSYEIL